MLSDIISSVLQGVLTEVQRLQVEPGGFGSRFKEVMKLSSTADRISGHQARIQELRSNFLVRTVAGQKSFEVSYVLKLMAAIDTNLHVHKVHHALSSGILPSTVPFALMIHSLKCF
jgi:hypothetical protein